MKHSKLSQYFPMIRTREQILLEIRSDPALNARLNPFQMRAEKNFSISVPEKKESRSFMTAFSVP